MKYKWICTCYTRMTNYIQVMDEEGKLGVALLVIGSCPIWLYMALWLAEARMKTGGNFCNA